MSSKELENKEEFKERLENLMSFACAKSIWKDFYSKQVSDKMV